MIAKRVVVYGRVQGVWYRAKTKEQSDVMNVKGWIRNLGNGAVEAHLEGEEDDVERLLTWMHMGPSLARVERVDDSDADVQNYTAFDVRRS